MPEDPTEVMPLDQLMDLASEPSTAPTVQFRRPAPPTPPPVLRTTTPAPAPLNPAAPKPVVAPKPEPQRPVASESAAQSQRPVASINWGGLLDQGEEKFTIATERVRDWLGAGDNGLIAATVAIALLLLVVVAAL